MTDVAPDTGTDATETEATTDVADTETVDWKAEAEKHKALARKHEDRAKANAAAAKELEQVKAASMSEQEKAVAEAMATVRKQTLAEVGSRLAASEVRVAAAGRLDDDQLSMLIDSVDLTKFLTDDGEVDVDKVRALVDGIAPKPTEGQPFSADLGQGSRGAPALNSDPLLDSLKKAVGIR